MVAYFVRRLLLMVPTFLGITFLVFLVTRFVPGGPIDQMLLQMQAGAGEAGGGTGGLRTSVDIPPEVLVELNRYFGLDKPFHIAYLQWLGDLLTGDLGR